MSIKNRDSYILLLFVFNYNFSQILLYGIFYYFSFVLFLDTFNNFIVSSSIYIDEILNKLTINNIEIDILKYNYI